MRARQLARLGRQQPRASAKLIRRILARLRLGSATDVALYQEMGCTLGHIYDARNREPLICCRAWVSGGFPGPDGKEMPGGNVLHLASKRELRSRRALLREMMKLEAATLRAIERRLR